MSGYMCCFEVFFVFFFVFSDGVEQNDETEDLYATHDDNQPGINMYAGNLVNHIGGVITPPNELRDFDSEMFDDDESMLSEEYDPSKKSQILSMHDDIMKHAATDETSTYSGLFTLPSHSKKSEA